MRLSTLIVFVAAGVSLVRGGTIVGGPADTNNCIPFSCAASFGITQYQQLYAPADFSGSLTITGLTFFDTNINNGSALSAGTYTLSLSTVSSTVGTFSSLIAVGGDNTQIFSGTLPAVTFGSPFTLSGGSFAYNPGSGSLLLNVQISGATNIGPALDARDNATGVFSRATNGSNTGTTGFGLVTQFESTSVPEPSSFSLGLLGLSALGLALLRRG